MRKQYTTPCFLPHKVGNKVKSNRVVTVVSLWSTMVTLGCINQTMTRIARGLPKYKRCVGRE